jgi:hypothetical protein
MKISIPAGRRGEAIIKVVGRRREMRRQSCRLINAEKFRSLADQKDWQSPYAMLDDVRSKS